MEPRFYGGGGGAASFDFRINEINRSEFDLYSVLLKLSGKERKPAKIVIIGE